MEQWTASIVRARTTIPWENSGPQCDVVTGLGATPELAVAALHANAEEAAHKVGQQTAELIETAVKAKREEEERHRQLGEDQPESRTRRRDTDTSWKFEVIDVRLVPGPTEGGSSGWLAYGTLTWYSLTPRVWDDRYG